MENRKPRPGHVGSLPMPQMKLADVPNGTPAHKSWHVESHRVMETVFEALNSEGGQRLVRLVGNGGSGKTTAVEIVRNIEVGRAFGDGIVWLTANDGAKKRLPPLML